MKNKSLPKKGFTLMEILVVISIIAILMGLLFPAINGALNQARKAAARNDVVQISNAVMAYQSEYGRLPNVSASGSVNSALVNILVGSNTTANPRRIVFLDAPAAKKNRSGTNSGGDYVDPWSNNYQYKLDDTYSGSISSAGQSNNDTVMRAVAVWNDTNKCPSANYGVKSYE